MSNVHQLQERLHHQFSNQQLLTIALSHRSRGSDNNERLEFLGDAVLGLTVSEYLYAKFPSAREGDLSRMRSQIVRAESLAQVAKNLQLGPELLLGPGEMKSGGHRRDSILGDTVEALIGAVYLDAGFDVARRCILLWFAELLDAALDTQPAKDAKTSLQEWLQQRGKPVPDYQLTHTGGEAHSRLFTVSCEIDALNQNYSATASSRRKAEQLVAQQILKDLEHSL
ncbi:MAG: ribonuclease III [Porticoccaceae bacterium]